jgi:hypothetical protein
MEEKVGFRRGLSAAIILGLYAGFMIAVGVAVTFEEKALTYAAYIWSLTIVVSSLLLTPILAKGRKRGRADTEEDVSAVRTNLTECNEGVGRWRTLSHVRGEGMGVSISLTDAKNPLLIIEKALHLSNEIRLIFRFTKNELELRERVLPILEQKVGLSRIQRKTKSLTIVPPSIMDRGIMITRSMMLCPPLMVGGAIGFSSIAPGQPLLAVVGGLAGIMLGLLIITNRGSM